MKDLTRSAKGNGNARHEALRLLLYFFHSLNSSHSSTSLCSSHIGPCWLWRRSSRYVSPLISRAGLAYQYLHLQVPGSHRRSVDEDMTSVMRMPVIAMMTPTRVRIASLDHAGEVELDTTGPALSFGNDPVGAACVARL